jgi:Flp pilus assembly CpaE family ATPase
VVLAELELPALRATRQRLDALAHRRPASVLRVARAQEPMISELQK